MGRQATREKVKEKTKEMKGGLVRRSGLVLQTTRGVRVRVGECEARKPNVREGFQWKPVGGALLFKGSKGRRMK